MSVCEGYKLNGGLRDVRHIVYKQSCLQKFDQLSSAPCTTSIISLFRGRAITIWIVSIDWNYIPNVFSGSYAFHSFRLQLIFRLPNLLFNPQIWTCRLYFVYQTMTTRNKFKPSPKSLSLIKLSYNKLTLEIPGGSIWPPRFSPVFSWIWWNIPEKK